MRPQSETAFLTFVGGRAFQEAVGIVGLVGKEV